MRLLDLFCCEGGASAGYVRAGFDVVGVDLEPQPRYPFDFVQGDATTYPLEGFDALHASPPCQDHSSARHAWGNDHGTGWMLAHTIERFRASGLPWVVENVDGAVMSAAGTLCGTSFGLGLHRHRRFETSFEWMAPPCDPSRVKYRGRSAEIFGHHGNTDRVRDEWDVPWMSQYGTAQCIPPAFAEYMGEHLMAALTERAA